jgi:hypothetical protein
MSTRMLPSLIPVIHIPTMASFVVRKAFPCQKACAKAISGATDHGDGTADTSHIPVIKAGQGVAFFLSFLKTGVLCICLATFITA